MTIKRLASLFLKLGIIGFGGPAAHIAMMRNEVVVRHKWMTDDDFLDLVGITNLIPGPNSTEMAIHIGKVKGGYRGLLVAGLAFIIPAVILTFILAVLYSAYGMLPQVQPWIYGIKPAIIAIIFSAVFPLAVKAFKNRLLQVIGVVSFVLPFLGFHEIWIMLSAGLIYLAFTQFKEPNTSLKSYLMLPLILVARFPEAAVSNTRLFFIFLKIGSILYGSGYVLFAFLDTELVETGILTKLQLTDAIAVGQMTPGPVFSSVTFIGYLLQGWQGALISTIAIFLPSFIFIALLSNVFEKLKSSPQFMAFLAGVNVSSVALIAAVGINLGMESIYDWRTLLIALVSLAVAFFIKQVNSALIIVGSAVMGFLLMLI